MFHTAGGEPDEDIVVLVHLYRAWHNDGSPVGAPVLSRDADRSADSPPARSYAASVDKSTVALVVSIIAAIGAIAAAAYARRQAIATEEANRINAGPTWRVIDATDTRFKLVNISRQVATGVTIDGSRIGCFNGRLPEKATISVGDKAGHVFDMAAMSGEQLPDVLYVQWDAIRPNRIGRLLKRNPWEAVPVERRPRPMVAYGD